MLCSGTSVLVKQVGYSVACQRLPSCVAKQRGTFRRLGADALDCRGCLFPEWTHSISASFTMDTDLSGSGQADIGHSDRQGFADPCTSVVEEEQDRVVPHTQPRGAIGLGEYYTYFLWFEITGQDGGCLLEGMASTRLYCSAKWGHGEADVQRRIVSR